MLEELTCFALSVCHLSLETSPGGFDGFTDDIFSSVIL